MTYPIGCSLDFAVERHGALESGSRERKMVVYRAFSGKYHGNFGNFVYLRVQQKEKPRIEII